MYYKAVDIAQLPLAVARHAITIKQVGSNKSKLSLQKKNFELLQCGGNGRAALGCPYRTHASRVSVCSDQHKKGDRSGRHGNRYEIHSIVAFNDASSSGN